MSAEPISLVRLLDLERLEVDLFRGISLPTAWLRAFGGQVASQALVAAGRTVDPSREVHSLHSYFIRPGDSNAPILYAVERVRDGRTFTTRRVTAIQGSRPIFTLSASFQVPAEGFEHQPEMPGVPDPDTLPTLEERFRSLGDAALQRRQEVASLLDLRWVDDPSWHQPRPAPRRTSARVWMRVVEPLPQDPLMHICALTYASDLTLLDAVLTRHGLAGTDVASIASLDHAMWFMRRPRADRWFLYDCSSPAAFGGRGLAAGNFYDRAGQQLCSVMQEGLFRIEEGR